KQRRRNRINSRHAIPLGQFFHCRTHVVEQSFVFVLRAGPGGRHLRESRRGFVHICVRCGARPFVESELLFFSQNAPLPYPPPGVFPVRQIVSVVFVGVIGV